MKTIFLLLIFSTINLVAFEYPFDVERLNVDFNGICNNNSSVLAYGTGSMILRTTDDGNTWAQIKVAQDSLEIKKIIYVNQDFFGILSDNGLIKSIDNGKSWKKLKIDGNIIYDINSSKDKIYLLSDNQVLVYGLDLNLIDTLNIVYNNSRKKFLVTTENILIPHNSGQLLIYKIKDRKQTEIINFKDLGLCNQCIEPFNLTYNGTSVVMTIDDGDLIKSTDEGNSWTQIAKGTTGFGKMIESDYYYIYLNSSTNKLGMPVFYKIDFQNINQLISQGALDRVVLYSDLMPIDFIKTNNNLFFAVGRNKTILKSTNEGLNWTVLSHFPYSITSYWVNDKLCYNYTYNGIVSKTTNGGITWLPQKTYPESIKQYSNFDLAYFDSLGTGFVYKSWGFSTEYNIMTTKDYGETFEYKDVENLRMNSSDNFKSRLIKKESGFTILNNMRIGKDHYTTIYSLDDNFNYIDYGILDSIVICEIFHQDGPNYIAIGLERRLPGPGQLDDDTFAIRQYWLINSDDYGRSWTKDKSFGYPGLINATSRINNNILVISSNKNPIVSNKYDYSLHNINLSTKNIYLSIYPDTISSLYSFFHFIDLNIVNGYYYNILNKNFPEELSNWSVTEKSSYNFANEFSGSNVSYLTGRFNKKPYLFKLIPKDTTTDVNTEVQIAFYANPPYPIPAKNYVSCQIFWDQRYDIDLSIFKVYNIYGSIVSVGEDFALNKANSYSGILTWTPQPDVPVGTYYIKINHGDAVKVVPVILLR